MSRSGYSDDNDDVALWRGRVASATRGKRGQAVARRLSRYAERAECDLGEAGAAMSLRAFAVGLRDLSDLIGERRMTIRPSSRHNARRAHSIEPPRGDR
jgi:hypothetical protein